MKTLLNVTLEDNEDNINRQIEVDENIYLKDMCEYIIVSMNGSKIPIYALKCGHIKYFPFRIKTTDKEKRLGNLQLKDWQSKKFTLEYNFEKNYRFNISVQKFYESDDKRKFRVISGKGYGILDNENSFHLLYLYALNGKGCNFSKSEEEYLKKTFDCKKCNENVINYMNDRKKIISPQRYTFDVSLFGLDREIKRKIIVNSNITVNKFCQGVILAMGGDVSKCFGLKIGRNYISEHYSDAQLYNLNLKEKQRFRIVYDCGEDSWTFNLTLSEVTEKYGAKRFAVISGKGYGIIEDVGGVWCLEEIFAGRDTSWGKYDINEFDLDKCNKSIGSI